MKYRASKKGVYSVQQEFTAKRGKCTGLEAQKRWSAGIGANTAPGHIQLGLPVITRVSLGSAISARWLFAEGAMRVGASARA